MTVRTFPRRAIVAVALAGALALALSGCGSSSSSSSGTAVASAGGTNSSARYQARLNLAKCFRAHGINVPDPTPPGGGGGGGGLFRQLDQYPQAQVQAARQACQQYLSQAFQRPQLSAAQRAQLQQQLIKFAQCMRSHGVNIPDPNLQSGGGFGFGQQFRSIDRNSPAFQAASAACASLRPQRFGRGGPGGGGTPPPGQNA